MHDVIVVGSGPGGSAAAAFLARSGIDVLLLDKLEFPRDKTCGDAISAAALHILGELGLGVAVENAAYRVERAAFTSPGGITLVTPIPAHPAFPDHVAVMRRIQMDELVRQTAEASGARFEGGVHIRGIEHSEEGIRVKGERKGKAYQAEGRIGILAVGASTALLRPLGLLPPRLEFAFAARAYYENIADLESQIHIRFDAVPLPGYGWVFPNSEHGANIGAGFYRRGRNTPATAAEAMRVFLEHEPIAAQLANARQMGPIKGYPLRTDFHRSPVIGTRLLLVGEAAGLVNPFTGEGIDYALESGMLAAEALKEGFQRGKKLAQACAEYERGIRRRFQSYFVWVHLLRSLYMNPRLLDPLMRACVRHAGIAQRMVRILLTYEPPWRAITPDVLWKVVRSA